MPCLLLKLQAGGESRRHRACGVKGAAATEVTEFRASPSADSRVGDGEVLERAARTGAHGKLMHAQLQLHTDSCTGTDTCLKIYIGPNTICLLLT